MKGLLHAIVTGLLSGIFSPICCLSNVLFGGVAIGAYLQFSVDERLSTKDVLCIGLVCGLTSGMSTMVLWYEILLRMDNIFISFSSAQTIQALQEQIDNDLWLYGGIHFLACPILATGGAFLSERLYATDH
ncbi:MAG: hypothetical protein VX278_15885 [Myxococcota bacterium]|nr:hypothetical protein [Myxococcota bacterium]